MRAAAKRAALLAASLLTLCTAAAGCDPAGGVATGNALANSGQATYGIAPMKPGNELGLLDVPLGNVSTQPLTITSIRLAGRGIGTVIQIAEVRIGPLTAGRGAIFGGAFSADPPAAAVGHTCHVQKLLLVRGYRLGPRQQARIWVVIRAVKTGKFSVTGHTVRYTQGGRSYDETITVGYQGSVSAAAAYIPPEPDELQCLKASGARLLPDLR